MPCDANAVIFEDPNLEQAVREDLHRQSLNPGAFLTCEDLEYVVAVHASGRGIFSLAGIEHCPNLFILDVGNNSITCIEPLRDLNQLLFLDLGTSILTTAEFFPSRYSANLIADATPLNCLSSLLFLNISNNLEIQDINFLSEMPNLGMLVLGHQEILDFSPLQETESLSTLSLLSCSVNDADVEDMGTHSQLEFLILTDNQITAVSDSGDLAPILQELHIGNNAITDITPLEDYSFLNVINLQNNLISTLEPLALNSSIAASDQISVIGNSGLTGTEVCDQLISIGERLNNDGYLAHDTNCTATLTITVEGEGTTYPLAPGQHEIIIGKEVTLYAVPASSSAYYFQEWDGDTLSADGAMAVINVLADKEVTAVFNNNSATDTSVIAIGTTGSGTGTTFPPPGNYRGQIGQEMHINAFPASGSYFMGWNPPNIFHFGSDYQIGFTQNSQEFLAGFSTSGGTITLDKIGGGSPLPNPIWPIYPVEFQIADSFIWLHSGYIPSGWYFKQWQGDLTHAISDPFDDSLVLDGNWDSEVAAEYIQESFLLHRRTVPAFMSGALSPGADSPYTRYAVGREVTTWVPTVVDLSSNGNGIWYFSHWQGSAGSDATLSDFGYSSVLRTLMDSDKEAIAVYSREHGSYIPGCKLRLKIPVSISDNDYGALEAVAFVLTAPEGWSFDHLPADSYDAVTYPHPLDPDQERRPRIAPATDATGALPFTWDSVPPELSSGDNTVDVVIFLDVPPTAEGLKHVGLKLLARTSRGLWTSTPVWYALPESSATCPSETPHSVTTSLTADRFTYIPEKSLRHGPQETNDCAPARLHSADFLSDFKMNSVEIDCMIALFNAGTYGIGNEGTGDCTDDGYIPGGTNHNGTPHDADCCPQDWTIDLTELTRILQFGTVGEYHTDPVGEDGFAPGSSVCNGIRFVDVLNENGIVFGSEVSGLDADNGRRYFYDERVMDAGLELDPYCRNQEYCRALLREAMVLAPGNALKWGYLRRSFSEAPTETHFDGFHAIVRWSIEHRQPLRFHTLLWHAPDGGIPRNPKTPEYPDTMNNAQVKSSLLAHSYLVLHQLSKYDENPIRNWDVSNEVIRGEYSSLFEVENLDTSTFKTEDDLREIAANSNLLDYNKSIYKIDTVTDIHKLFRQTLPSATLFYNDGGGESVYALKLRQDETGLMFNQKTERIFRFLEYMRSPPLPGGGTGAPLVDGVGQQMHLKGWWFRGTEALPECLSCTECEESVSMEDVTSLVPWLPQYCEGITANFSRLQSELSLQVEITEMDVDISHPDNVDWAVPNYNGMFKVPDWWKCLDLETRRRVQGKIFYEVIRAAQQGLAPVPVTVWGISDAQSWLPGKFGSCTTEECRTHVNALGGIYRQTADGHLYDQNLERKTPEPYASVLKALRETAEEWQ